MSRFYVRCWLISILFMCFIKVYIRYKCKECKFNENGNDYQLESCSSSRPTAVGVKFNLMKK